MIRYFYYGPRLSDRASASEEHTIGLANGTRKVPNDTITSRLVPGAVNQWSPDPSATGYRKGLSSITTTRACDSSLAKREGLIMSGRLGAS